MEQVSKKSCHSCQKTGQQLLRCARCKNVYYCDIQCQRKDWPSHKLNCKKSSSEPQKPKNDTLEGINEFQNLQHVGTGNFTSIFKATSKKDGQVYAIKQAQKAKVERLRKTADLFMEKHCLSKLKDCPYVVKLYRTFQDQIHLFLQMEFPEQGQLWEQAKHFGIISQSLFKYYAYHTLKSVQVIHEQYSIVHRDLKPENILLNNAHQLKLIDFGTAKDLSRPDIKGSGNGLKGRKPFQHYVGTPNYMAPQCIHNKASQKISDVYSLSGLLYFLKVGSPPFSGGSEFLIFQKSLQTELLLCPELFDSQLSDLLLKMNKKDMSQRLPLVEALKHQYFKAEIEKEPTYIEALAGVTPFEDYVMTFCKEICQNYAQLYKEPVEKREKIYNEEILPKIDKVIEEVNNEWKEDLQKRMSVIKLQIQIMINLRDDNNIGFTELYQELHKISQPELVDPYKDEEETEHQEIKESKPEEICANQ